jgi:hypothetical protein
MMRGWERAGRKLLRGRLGWPRGAWFYRSMPARADPEFIAERRAKHANAARHWGTGRRSLNLRLGWRRGIENRR